MEEIKDEKCYDCKKAIEVEGEEIKNGVLLAYQDGDEKKVIFKCSSCYEKNPGLTNFRQCEVYSRVVGYLRPVQQWHVGKKQEFEDRKNYKIPEQN
jgi:ribonucleoside-triphosphate reductase